MEKRFTVPPLPSPERLDKFLVRNFPQSSRQYWRDHLESSLRVDGKVASKSKLLFGGELIEVFEDPAARDVLIPNPKIALRILYQDDQLLALDKPAGLPCHPVRPGETETLANALVAAFPRQAELQPTREAGLVQRLDNGTSGVLLIAKDASALEKIRRLSQDGGMLKTYLAIVEGRLSGTGMLDRPIGHHPRNAKKMLAAADPGEAARIKARPALTRYESLASSNDASLLKLEIKVGARHQIRVHLASLGNPILGDQLYGAKSDRDRHFLHAAELAFVHPWTGDELRISAAPPEEFQIMQSSLFPKIH